MRVAPLAAGQRLHLEVRVVVAHAPVHRADVPRVEEDERIGRMLAHQRTDPLLESQQHLHRVLLPILGALRVEALREHALHAVAADAWRGVDDVEEEAVAVEAGQDLLDVFGEEVHVGRVLAEAAVKARLEGLRAGEAAVGIEHAPLGVALARVVVPLDGDVDRHEDVVRVTGIDLPPEQVGLQLRMHSLRMALGGVVDPAVVAAREAADLIDVRVLQRLHKAIGIEGAPDAGDILAGVEVEVDGSVAQIRHSRSPEVVR